MAVRTLFNHHDFAEILSQYDLGTYTNSEAVAQGTVQTNFFVHTTQGKFVFRYYESRSKESVLFESQLLTYLSAHDYPCPRPLKQAQGAYVGMVRGKPYMLFTFIEGYHIDKPTDHHKQQLIQKVAELQNLTKGYDPPYKAHRWNYDADLCRRLARKAATKIDTQSAREKFTWLEHTLSTLDLPPTLPRGICHCDFDVSNVLFQDDEFVALLDFDDANYTFLTFDLVSLIDSWAWPHQSDVLNIKQAQAIVQAYVKHRPVTRLEQRHMYDVHKLSILIDCVWFFERGHVSDFYEKRKIDFLNALGRDEFVNGLFSK